MPRNYQPNAERLRRANVALENAQNDPVLEGPLAAFGYDDARIQEGQDLLAAARDAQDDFVREYGEQFEATDDYLDAREQATETYMRHVKVARVAFDDDDDRATRRTLRLNGRRKEVLAEWLEQTRLFYRGVLDDADYQAALARFNVTPEDLQTGLDEVNAVEAADVRQEKEKGEAQQATDDRNEAIDALDKYMSDFREIARVAFEDQPQQLEKLHIKAPSA